MTAPRFALITDGAFRKLSASEQMDICDEAEANTWVPCKNNRTVDHRLAYLREAKAVYWDRQPKNAKAMAMGADASIGDITATEANEWLRSMPPVPLHGEAR